jgi:hypothetical protein
MHLSLVLSFSLNILLQHLTPKGPETVFKPFLKFGQAIVKAIFIKIHELNCEHVV